MTKILKFLLMTAIFYVDEPGVSAPTGDTPPPSGDTPPAGPALDADGKPIENAGTKALTEKTPEELQADKDAADAEAAGMKVPETPDGYKLPVPEGDDGVFAKEAAAWFHEAGIPPAQAEKLALKWNEYVAAQQGVATEAAANADKQLEVKFNEENSALKKEWGDKYDGNIELGKRAVKQFEVSADVLNAIEDKVGPAGLFKFFAKIGAGLGEDTMLGITNSNTNVSGTGAETLYPAHYK